MLSHPLVAKLLCVALVASFMLPLGWVVFPMVESAVSRLQFDTAEAILSATIGFGLYAMISG